MLSNLLKHHEKYQILVLLAFISYWYHWLFIRKKYMLCLKHFFEVQSFSYKMTAFCGKLNLKRFVVFADFKFIAITANSQSS